MFKTVVSMGVKLSYLYFSISTNKYNYCLLSDGFFQVRDKMQIVSRNKGLARKIPVIQIVLSVSV